MSTDIARADADDEPHARGIALLDPGDASAALAHVLGTGDLYRLSNEQRVAHYINLCRSVGLNPLTRPYQWIEFKERDDGPAVLTLYFKPTAAAQVLRNNHVSVHYPRKEIVGELFVCEAHGRTPDGREGVGTKYVPLTGKYGKLQGRHLANAFMTAETGALRRLALNMGLAAGPDPEDGTPVRTVYVDGTGAVLDAPTEEQRHLADHPETARVLGEPTYESTAASFAEIATDLPSQAPRADELERPTRGGAKPTLKPSDEDVKRWLGAWFAAVKGSSLDDDAERHRFIRQWTTQYPKGSSLEEGIGRTDSLRAFFGAATERQAGDLLAHVRALVADEKRAILEADITNARGEPF